MTYHEFLTALEQTPRDWQVVGSDGRFLRRYDTKIGWQCPVSVLTNAWYLHAWRSGNLLGLSNEDRSQIVSAADGLGPDSIRRDLLKACGLPCV